MATPKPEIEVGEQQETEYPGSSALATDVVLNMAQLSGRMLAYGLGLIAGYGLTSIAAFNVLTILHGEGGPLLPSTIADRMILTRGTVTGVLGSLERAGLVEREAHATDGRMRPVRITQKGRARVDAILPQLHDVERRWMEALTETQQRQLLRMIAAVQAAGPDRD